MAQVVNPFTGVPDYVGTGGGVPSGAAGGDLSGTYPNPTVAKLNTVPLGLTTPTAGNLLVADGANWVTRALSGDATLSATGLLTLATVPIAKGGTGQTTALTAFNALSPLTTRGDLLTRNVTDNARVPIGSPGQVLLANTDPTWTTLTGNVTVNATGVTTIGAAQVTDGMLVTPYVKADGTRPLTADWAVGSFKLTGLADPSALQDAATKNYVDQVAGGLEAREARLATAAALPANTYNNGVLGVGATLVGTGNGALTVDGTTVAVGDRILVKNEATAANNGIYVVTAVGSTIPPLPYILTRSLDMDDSDDFAAVIALVIAGTANANTAWLCATAPPVTVGTTAINWTQYQVGQGTTVGGDLSGTVGNATVARLNGGLLGTTTPVTRGDLLVANATPAFARLAKGTANQAFRMDGTGTDPGWGALATAALPLPLDHSADLTNFLVDNHTQYTLRAGRSGTTNDTILNTAGPGVVGTLTGSTQQHGELALLASSIGTGDATSSPAIRVASNIGARGSNPRAWMIFDAAPVADTGTSLIGPVIAVGSDGSSAAAIQTWLFNANTTGQFHALFTVNPNIQNTSAAAIDCGTLGIFNFAPTLMADTNNLNTEIRVIFNQLLTNRIGAGRVVFQGLTDIYSQPGWLSGDTVGSGVTGGRRGLWYRNNAFGGSVGTVNLSIAVDVENQTAASFSSVAAALRSAMNAGTNKWSILATGNANSAFAGPTVFGAALGPTATSVGLEVQSTSKVFLPSRLTTTQRDTSVTPTAVDGMLYYNTDRPAFQGRKNGAWVDFQTTATLAGASDGSAVVVDTETLVSNTEREDWEFTITDANVSVTSRILAWAFDELDEIHATTKARSGSFDMRLHAIDAATNGLLKGKYNIAYLVA